MDNIIIETHDQLQYWQYQLLKIYDNSIYLQNLLDNSDEVNDEIFEQIFNLLNLNITNEKCIEYLLNLIDNYKTIKYIEENIYYYIVLSDYFQLNIQDEFFIFVLNDFILNKKIFYNKLHSYQPFNYYILDKFSKENYITNETFAYIFEINKNISNEIKKLFSSNIEQKLLYKCNFIVDLNICNNDKINNVNHLKLLETLDISDRCGVNQHGISKLLSVKKLTACYNHKIVDINHLQLLETLYMSHCCGITQNGIMQLLFVKHLLLRNNTMIKSINHLQELESLDISYSNVNQNGISKLIFVKHLIACDNQNITNVNHLQFLKSLHITGICGVDQYGISQLLTITYLNANCNKQITNVNHLQLLEKLFICYNCGVDQNGVSKLKSVIYLDAFGNNKITNCNEIINYEKWKMKMLTQI